MTFTDSSNLIANDWGFLEGPSPPILHSACLRQHLQYSIPSLLWLQHHRCQLPLVTPWSAVDVPREGNNCKAEEQEGSSQLWSLLSAQRKTAGNNPFLAAIPGDGCYTFTSILLPYDSAPRASSIGATKFTCLEGWGLSLPHTHIHTHPAQVVKLSTELL